MRLIATIYPARSIDWRIKVDSRPTNYKGQEIDTGRPLLDTWVPPRDPNETYLIYNPRIALVGKSRNDSRYQEAKDVFMPATLLYAFANKLMIAYQYLTTPGLYKRDGGQLYMDTRLCQEGTQKLSVYHGSVIITPTIIPETRNSGELIGVQFTMDSMFAGTMSHTEVREFCEILTHTDIQTYALILATFEKLDNMDKKLDAIMAMQNQILQLLGQEHIEKAKLKDTSTGLDWKFV